MEGDGGSITLHSFRWNSWCNLKECNGCPSSTVTLKQGIEGLLKQKMGDKIKNVTKKKSDYNLTLFNVLYKNF